MASSTNWCRGIAPMAASVTSSRIPCSRSRISMRSRVRWEVMPMPDFMILILLLSFCGRFCLCSQAEPVLQGIQLLVLGEVDLQRRQRHLLVLYGIKIRARAGILCAACRAHPVNSFTARRGRLDDRLGLVTLAQPGDSHAAQFLIGNIRHINIEQQRRRKAGLFIMPDQILDHSCGGQEVLWVVAR